LKFKIPFDKKTYLNQVKLLIPIVYSDLKRRITSALIFGITLLILGLAMVFSGTNLGFVFIITGVILLINSYLNTKKYKTNRETYLNLVEQNLIEKLTDYEYGIFEFNDDNLTFSNKTQNRIFKWTEFQDYKIIERNLFLVLDKYKGEIYVIGEKEINNTNFKKVIEFVKSRINLMNLE
jgi:hypothetical protein